MPDRPGKVPQARDVEEWVYLLIREHKFEGEDDVLAIIASNQTVDFQ
jgi:hypothetical protein